MTVDVVRASAADRLLHDEGFRAEWADLCRRCPWATPFQGPGFATAWYSSYREHADPVLVLHRTDGRLDGLMALAVTRPGGDRPLRAPLAAVGGDQAEYQGWVCVPELAAAFVRQVLDVVGREWPTAGLVLRYLPPGTPLDGIDPAAARIRTHRRPLLRVGDGSEIEASLRKGSNRTRLRRLQKLGDVEFRQLGTAAELDKALDEVIAHHDTRHIVVHGNAAFLDDPCKRPFHLAMADVPGLLHTTVMTVGGRVASAHLGASGRDEVQIGVIAHNPWFARHSPGKFHVYFLARMLREQGYRQLDLTAGGDPYKERFANAWDEVHTLDVLPTAWVPRAVRRPARRVVGALGRRVVRLVGRGLRVSTTEIRSRLHEVRHRGLRGAAAAVRCGAAPWAEPDHELRVYRHDLRPTGEPAPPPAALETPGTVRRDGLADLLAYRPSRFDPSRRRFVAAALRRIEDGQHLYTCTEGDRLVHAGWLAEPATAARSDAVPDVTCPAGAALLHGLYTAPGIGDPGLVERALRTAVRDAAESGGANELRAAVPVEDTAARRVLEAVGFREIGHDAG